MSTPKNWALIGLVVLILACLAFTGSIDKRGVSTKNTFSTAPEIKAILELKNPQEQNEELKKLLMRVGPEEAQEQMLASGLPFTGETHLLIHTIGNYIYTQYGLDGLSLCREYFLSACYHGFIIKALGDHGLDGIATAMDKCAERGGPTVAVQCAHAAGHGFVAWHDYDLLKALKTCDSLGEKVKNFAYFNCYDGAFMENVWGVHDGKPSDKRWVKEDDIYYPCTATNIPDKYMPGCWSNQATLLYQRYNGDLKKTAMACDAVKKEGYREICYNNFSRQIHPLTQGKKDKAIELCANATGEHWQNYCIMTIVSAAWSVGDRVMPFELCAALEEGELQNCFGQLTGMIRYYYPENSKERRLYCEKIPLETYRKQCQQ